MGVNVGVAAGSAIKTDESEALETPSLVAGVAARGSAVAAEKMEESKPPGQLAKQRSAVLDPEEDPGDVAKEVGDDAKTEAARYSFQKAAVRRFSKDLMDNPQNILQLPGTQEFVTKIERQMRELQVLPMDLFTGLGSLLLSIIVSHARARRD